MRILIIHRYFWPDTPPYASILRAIAGRWTDDGHDVTVLTGQPSYGDHTARISRPTTERMDGFEVRRVRLFKESKSNFVIRGFNVVLFMARILIHVVFHSRKYDIVMAATTPPVMIAWTASIAASVRRAKFVYHCQDIHPELLELAGLVKEGFLSNWLRNRDKQTVNRAARVVVLSRDMKETLLARGEIESKKIVTINNFMVPIFEKDDVSEVPGSIKHPGKFRVLFAGNLGFFQGLETLIDAAKLLETHSNIEYVFLGEGAAKKALLERAGSLLDRTIFFHSVRPQREAEEFVRNADLSLISLSSDIYRAAFPSKTMTYLKMGSPILVTVEVGSELAELTQERRLGYVSAPGDPEALSRNILEASAAPDVIQEMRRNAISVSNQMFCERRRLDDWSALLQGVARADTLQPLFLIGAGRSGTKFVRDMLSASTEVAVVPFDVGYVWRTGNEDKPHDELPAAALTDDTRLYIRRVLGKLARLDASPSASILLEKSVPNSLRVEFIRAVYPDARFIHLIRDGRSVAESAIRQWQKPAESRYLLQKLRYFPWSNYRYAFWYLKNALLARLNNRVRIWGPRYLGMEEDIRVEPLETVCARQWKRCVMSSIDQLKSAPPEQVLQISYEELVADENVATSICDFAGINDKEAVLNFYRDKLIKGNDSKWHSNLSSQQKKLVLNEIDEMLVSLGYGL